MSEQKSIDSDKQESFNDRVKSSDKDALPMAALSALTKPLKKEINGPKGLEPTRYGDWESKGRCSDF